MQCSSESLLSNCDQTNSLVTSFSSHCKSQGRRMLQRTNAWLTMLAILVACIQSGCRTASKVSCADTPGTQPFEFAVRPVRDLLGWGSKTEPYLEPPSTTKEIAAAEVLPTALYTPENGGGAEPSTAASETSVTSAPRSSVSDSLLFNRTYTSPTSGCTKGCCANR